MKTTISFLILTSILLVCSYSLVPAAEKDIPALKISSSAFNHEAPIPSQYTCQGENVSPPLQWSNAPQETKSFALIVDDPDAPRGTWVHWVIYNIPAMVTSFPEGVPKVKSPKSGGVQGISDFRKLGYGGPCPPSGTHRYFFKLYALDTTLALSVGATKAKLLEAMAGHILAQGTLMGTFSK